MKLSRSLILFAACLFSLYAPYTLQASFLARTRQAIANSLSTISKPSIAQSTFRASLQSFMQSSSLSSSWNRCKTLSTNLFSQPMLASPNKSFFKQSTAHNPLINPLLRQHNNNNHNHRNNQNHSNVGKPYIRNGLNMGVVATIFSTTLLALDEIKQYYYGPAVNKDKPVTIFAHGLRQNQRTGFDYYHAESKSKNGFIEGPLVTFNFNYRDEFYNLSSLGQAPDINTLHNVCKNYKEIDAAGVSCGASTLFDYLATYNPKNIKSAVIEAAFTNSYNVRIRPLRIIRGAGFLAGAIGGGFIGAALLGSKNHSLDSFGLIAGGLTGSMGGGLLGLAAASTIDPVKEAFPIFNPKGISPEQCAAKLPKEIPILLVCSMEDTLIEYVHSHELFNTMKSAGHNKVYLLNLQHGEHAHILESLDGTTYRNVVHAFYRHHNRPYNKTWADAGQKRFERCPGFATKA